MVVLSRQGVNSGAVCGIKPLARQGHGIKEIVHELRLARNTVRDICVKGLAWRVVQFDSLGLPR